ncbi:MAG: cytochrome c family protein [Myxococcaceae bacterium]
MRRSTSWSRASSGELKVVALALLLGACTTVSSTPSSNGPKTVTLFFSSQVRGFLGPCGCSENMRGGLSRAALQIEEARKDGHPVFFFDCGDGLFGEQQIPELAVPQQERKAQALAAGWKAMGLTARVPGPMDDVRGAEFRAKLGLPELSGFQVVEGVAVLSAKSTADAVELGKKARAKGARFVIAVVPNTAAFLLKEALDAEGIDLLVSSHLKDAFGAEENRLAGGTRKVAQIQSKGRSLLRVDVTFRVDGPAEWVKGDAERDREVASLDQRIELLRAQVNEPMLSDELKALRKGKLEEVIARRTELASAPIALPEGKNSATARFIPLESSFAKEPKVAELEKAYDVDVGLMNLEAAKTKGVSCAPVTRQTVGYIGTAECVSCHVEAEAVWKKTKHPLAWKSLVDQGKENHLDCIGCHVTGWQQPGGVCRLNEEAGRQEVGCESCHGPGSAHADDPKKGNIARMLDAKQCVGCHDRENSPHFDFDAYVDKVLGPGHGR